MRPNQGDIIDRIERQAERKGVELEAVRPVDGMSDPTFRVLAVDAEHEEDQVGFQISHPEGPLARQMFDNNLDDYLDALKRTLNGTDSVIAEGDSRSQHDSTEATDSANTSDESETTTQPQDELAELAEEAASGETDDTPLEDDEAVTTTGEVEYTEVADGPHVEVSLSIENVGEIEETIEESLGPIDSVAELDQRLSSLEDLVEEVDDRLTAIEDGLSGFTSDCN